mmetsp:Transcript_71702/g.226541  ORF Transcript_71702/g.226541 Transcript_71702/m.226541 type:complete len:402 (+) Transcript_71702:221-1426(+)|eukprot:CAMPEP_0182912518 /NCGR_PEP_ID=MMETSP0034_2-20130328/37553_1 /TAXON_ID=156128 /ORGANISM="Nephroselmis pyriformis, Strain CCMP717" /LENGTH=401 /DNA_ID=CAMNT_0025049193 /DNA_START=147 /DNA_END=1352 /DNA_ORIENTATION=+
MGLKDQLAQAKASVKSAFSSKDKNGSAAPKPIATGSGSSTPKARGGIDTSKIEKKGKEAAVDYDSVKTPKTPKRQAYNRDGYLLVITDCCPENMAGAQGWRKEDFEFKKAIGSGCKSTVYHVVCKHTKTDAALKVYPKAVMSDINKQQVMREVSIHSTIRHKYIIGLYASWEDDRAFYMVQEYAHRGDLFGELYKMGGKMSERKAVELVMGPYLDTLNYIHAKGIIHRDIKPENTLFSKELILKVTDFGLSIDTRLEQPVTRLGTLDYMAPEVLVCPDKNNAKQVAAAGRYDFAVDAWAMGVLAFEVVVGRAPFEGETKDKTCSKIMREDTKFPSYLSAKLQDFISKSLNKHATKRMGIPEMMEHPWITEYYKCEPVTVARTPHTGEKMTDKKEPLGTLAE